MPETSISADTLCTSWWSCQVHDHQAAGQNSVSLPNSLPAAGTAHPRQCPVSPGFWQLGWMLLFLQTRHYTLIKYVKWCYSHKMPSFNFGSWPAKPSGLLPASNMWSGNCHLQLSSSNLVVTEFSMVMTTVVPENAIYESMVSCFVFSGNQWTFSLDIRLSYRRVSKASLLQIASPVLFVIRTRDSNKW